jgi:hypothetical protein
VGPNGPERGHRQVGQSHFGEVTAAGFPDDPAQSVRSRSCHNPRNRVPGRPWLVTAQSGTDTVWTPQPGRDIPDDRDRVDLAQAGRGCPVIARAGHRSGNAGDGRAGPGIWSVRHSGRRRRLTTFPAIGVGACWRDVGRAVQQSAGKAGTSSVLGRILARRRSGAAGRRGAAGGARTRIAPPDAARVR